MKYFLILFMFIGNLAAQNIPLYVGTYTNTESKGIYYYNFSTNTGELTNKKLVAEINNPSFLTISSDRKFLYAVSEFGNENGTVNAYSINNDGSLTFINNVSSEGNSPCHVQLNENNSKLVVSNYGGGNIAIYNINKNGSIQDASQVIDHNVPGITSHAHSAKFYKNNLFVADLGRDFLAQYVEKNKEYVLKENFKMSPKAGPRHFVITKNEDFIYVINELNSTITALKKESKTFTEIQTISTLENNYVGMNACADIHLSKNERFLYGSNRGENSIVVFKRDLTTGTLEKIQSISVEGDWPRNFTLSPNGNFLLVANQKSNSISVYKVDDNSGKLSYLKQFSTPIPVCLIF